MIRLEESESPGWFPRSSCSQNSPSRIILSNRFKGPLTEPPPASSPGRERRPAPSCEMLRHRDDATHSFRVSNSTSWREKKTALKLKAHNSFRLVFLQSETRRFCLLNVDKIRQDAFLSCSKCDPAYFNFEKR